jgi:cell division GTPase FtsZ
MREGIRRLTRREILKVLGLSTLAGGMGILHTASVSARPTSTESKLAGQIVGVGCLASYFLDQILERGKPGLQSILICDFSQVAASSNVNIRIHLGGSFPEKNDREGDCKPCGKSILKTVKPVLAGSELNFIIACLGEEMESYATPLVAKWSKDSGAQTVVFVTTPFTFEGEAALRRASWSLKELRKNSYRIYVHDQSRFPRTGFTTFKSLIDESQSQFVRLVKHTVF